MKRRLLALLAVGLGTVMVPSVAGAGHVNQEKAQHAQQLFDQGMAAVQAGEYPRAIDSFENGLNALQEATTSTDLFGIPTEEMQPYQALYYTLIKNILASYFQAGQALANVGAAGVETASLKQAAGYFTEMVNRIARLESAHPDIKRVLDEGMRFDGPWPSAPSSSGGPLSFSDYYLGGCYVNLALIAVYLNDQASEDQWLEQLTALKQPQLLVFFQQAAAEARASGRRSL